MDSIADALQELRNGKMIIVVDDENRENEGDFVIAAEKTTPDTVNFMLKEGRGILCVSLPGDRCDELQLQMMENNNSAMLGTPFTVSVDLTSSTTGVASDERAATIKALVDPTRGASDFGRPGHIFPLRARPGGVSERAGHTEAVVDLTRLAGLAPGGALIEIMNEDGSMARLPQLEKIAEKFGLKLVSIKDLLQYKCEHAQ